MGDAFRCSILKVYYDRESFLKVKSIRIHSTSKGQNRTNLS